MKFTTSIRVRLDCRNKRGKHVLYLSTPWAAILVTEVLARHELPMCKLEESVKG